MLEKLRSGEPLTAKEKQIHDQGLVTVLRQIHDELDNAVLEAYGWGDLSRSVGVPPTSGDIPCGRDAHTPREELLTRLVALNHERAAEEKSGLIRYLRPDYQNPNAAAAPRAMQGNLAGTETSAQSQISNPLTPLLFPWRSPRLGGSNSLHPPSQIAWPPKLPEQVALLRKLLATTPPDAASLSAHFGRKNKNRTEQIEGILETLKGLGQL